MQKNPATKLYRSIDTAFFMRHGETRKLRKCITIVRSNAVLYAVGNSVHWTPASWSAVEEFIVHLRTIIANTCKELSFGSDERRSVLNIGALLKITMFMCKL